MQRITNPIRLDREFRSASLTLSETTAAKTPLPIVVNGLSGGAADAFLAEAIRDHRADPSRRPAMVFTRDESEAVRVAAMLTDAGLSAAAYPAREFCLHHMTASHDLERERLSVLYRALSGEFDAVVTTPFAALQPTVSAERLADAGTVLSPGSILSPDVLLGILSENGYRRVDTVESAGQFTRRGGIVDVFPGGEASPFRFDFFGDEVDRICRFDPLTQRITETLTDPVTLLPAREIVPTPDALARVREIVSGELSRLPAPRAGRSKTATPDPDADAKAHAREVYAAELAALERGTDLSFLDKYFPLVSPDASTLPDFLPGSGHPVVFLLGTNEVRERLEGQSALVVETIKNLLDAGVLIGKYAITPPTEAALDRLLSGSVAVHVNPFGGGVGATRLAGLFGFRCRRTVSYAGRFEMLSEEIGSFLAGGYRILLLAGSDAEAEALTDSLRERDLPARRAPSDAIPDAGTVPAGAITVGVGAVSSGYDLLNARVAVLTTRTDEERADAIRRRQVRSRHKASAGKRILSYADLTEGDYVVHANYGIGIFEGIETITVAGATRDYIAIRYAGTDKLFLPAERLEMISRYIGAKAEDGTVRLSRLGGPEWGKAKAKAKTAAKEMAKELIDLYARRQRRPGFSFSPDGEMEREFADAFEFEETESQTEAIREIKADMLRPVPMDRLLCGDVGYGKTEVALRAAFKAIVSGKQVAILVPTTILALQHYQTALSRMRGFPVTVEMLSRFRSPKESAAILRRLKRGEIDLIVGTHALLGASVSFRDLGLLIVDEEQRFGVAQKEKLKKLAADVDVLTLTATPIPRTLNMAMSGIRDMSILDEAPGDRHPVETFVLAHDDVVIGEAMRRELARGGQVLYLYNKIDDIDLVAGRVKRALPEARVAYAHGRMEKDELEDIWQSLVRGEIDVLVCTTIIETGVDLPNANTLIIENADRMGLSQLHQIRGRVGRSSRHAYAYFTFRPGKALSEIAVKRLSAIREYAEFGAGFKIALRDLEIRGAGNLLGAEQHGHIDSVGYDLYIRLLNEAILEEQGKVAPEISEAKIEYPDSANIPASYIPLSAHRMEMYKKISLILSEDDLHDVETEFRERFGEPPRETRRLLWLSLLRAAASRIGLTKVEFRGSDVRFTAKGVGDLSVWALVFAERPGLRFGGGRDAGVFLRPNRGEDAAESAARVLLLYEEKKKELHPEQQTKEEPNGKIG